MKEAVIATGLANPGISIAMATYDGEAYIAVQLNNLAPQTVLRRELAMTDDGLADATLKIISEFATTTPFPVGACSLYFGSKARYRIIRDNFAHGPEAAPAAALRTAEFYRKFSTLYMLKFSS